jgi:predicted ATPase
MNRLTKIEIAGFKSIRAADLDLGPLNVLIGANGSGKSNLVSFFWLFSHIKSGTMQDFVTREGGAHSLLYRGPKRTSEIIAYLWFREHKMALRQPYAPPDILAPDGWPPMVDKTAAEHSRAFRDDLPFCRVFQFHDTSKESGFRQAGYIDDSRYLRRDGGNLAAFLYRLQQTNEPCYRRIVSTIQQVTPFFHDFELAPDPLSPRNILLNWRERGSDYLLGPHQLSDGSLRAMALMTLLLQPEDELPDVILIDEPELGLNPAALQVLASVLRSVSVHSQIIVATQSVPLVNHSEPEDIVVVERGEEGTTFHRVDSARLHEWLEEYTMGELWEKNVIGGRPSR